MQPRPDPALVVHRAGDRFHTRLAGIDTRHSFSFGRHYDSRNTSHGPLLVHDETVLAPGAGFDPHPHRDVEILTWLLAGSLVHTDSEGRSTRLTAGAVQRTSAGGGVVHAERNDAFPAGGALPAKPAHLLQMWITPDEVGGPSSYEVGRPGRADRAGLVPVASGRPLDDTVVRLGARNAVLHVGRLAAGEGVTLPEAVWLHLFVASGEVALEGAGRLGAGDAARSTHGPARRLVAHTPAEVVVWEMQAAVAA